MGNSIGTLSAKATLDAQGFTVGADRATRAAREAATGINQAFARINPFVGLSPGGLFGLAGGLGLASLEDYIKRGEDAVRTQVRLSQALGSTREQAAALMAVGAAAGQSADEIQGSALRAMRHLGELRGDLAKGGTGGATGASLRALGLDPAEFANIGNFSQQIGILGDRLRNVTNAADRAAIMHAVLGRGFETFMPQLRLGSAGMERFAQLAGHFGVTVGEEATDAITAAGRATREFHVAQGMAAEGLRNQFAASFEVARHGAESYAAATQRLIDQQPELQAGARGLGRLTGDIAHEADRIWRTVSNAIGEAYARITEAPPPPLPPAEAAGLSADDIRRAQERIPELQAEVAHWREIEASTRGLGGLMFPSQESQAARERMEFAAARLNRDQRIAASAVRPDEWMSGPELWMAGQAEAQGMSQATANAIADVTDAIHRQNEAYGLTREEIQRNQFAQSGASAEDLASLDKKIERMRELARAERETAQLLQLQELQNTPLDVLRRRIGQVEAQGEFLNTGQRGAAILDALGGAGRLRSLAEAPLLGSLSANTAETAAILQGAMTPEVDLLAAANVLLEAIAAESRETNRLQEVFGGQLRDIKNFLDSIPQ